MCVCVCVFGFVCTHMYVQHLEPWRVNAVLTNMPLACDGRLVVSTDVRQIMEKRQVCASVCVCVVRVCCVCLCACARVEYCVFSC